MPPKQKPKRLVAATSTGGPQLTLNNSNSATIRRRKAASALRFVRLTMRNNALSMPRLVPRITFSVVPNPAIAPEPPLPHSPSQNTLQPLPQPGEVNASIIDDEVALQIFGEFGVKRDDQFLNSGKLLAWALQPDDPAFINIHDYIGRGQLHGFGVKILSILRIIPKADSLESNRAAPLDFSDDPSAQGQLRMMLWHGTKRTNLRAILENGLKLPPSHGQMFGSGIYFADRVSKSCQYCDNAYVIGGEAYLLLCDVLLGKVYKAYEAMATLTGPPEVDPEAVVDGDGVVVPSSPFTSVKGCGLNVPDYQWDQFIDGCIWPLGPTIVNPDITAEKKITALKFNEYIVYDASRVQPKYLVKVEFTPHPVHELLY